MDRRCASMERETKEQYISAGNAHSSDIKLHAETLVNSLIVLMFEAADSHSTILRVIIINSHLCYS